MTNPKDLQDTYYVGLNGAVELRRTLLESAKSVVETISAHKRIQQIQEDKLKLRTQLVHVIHDLRQDLHGLHVKLPQRQIPEVKASVPVASVAAPKKRPDSKLDKIEAALAEIESRMKGI